MKILSRVSCLLLSAILLSGCTGREYVLDPKWRPLEAVLEGTDKLLNPNMTMTIGAYCYVADLKTWLDDHPPDSVLQEAILRHEQVHSKRQLDNPLGVGFWLAHYITVPSFRWQEEKLGYKEQIKCLISHGLYVNVDGLARVLNEDYKVAGIPMVSFNEAKTWIQYVIDHPNE